MSWTYEINTTLHIVNVVYKGNISTNELIDSSSYFIKLEKEKGIIRFLVDTNQVESFDSLTDLYSLPTSLYTKEDADRLGQVAIILPTSQKIKEAIQFYEMVCKNRGWRVQTFSERQPG